MKCPRVSSQFSETIPSSITNTLMRKETGFLMICFLRLISFEQKWLFERKPSGAVAELSVGSIKIILDQPSFSVKHRWSDLVHWSSMSLTQSGFGGTTPLYLGVKPRLLACCQ
jgi:hypothetical protein